MKRVLVALAAAMSLFACGGSSNQSPQQFEQAQKPVTPKGLIVGRVIDTNTQAPVEGVTVKVLGSDATLTSSADGVFTLTDAVAGSTYTFILEKGGYLRRTIARTVPSSAGNSPLAGGLTTFIVELYPSVGSITGVLTLPNGKPAASATVFVDQNQSVGAESTVSTQTGMDGSFTLMGLATAGRGVTHTVYAQWFDENGDMQADYSTVGASVTVYPGQPARVFLAYSALTQRIVSTNIFDGELAAGEDMQFTFALPLFTGVLSGAAAAPWVLTHVATNSEIPLEGTFMSATQLRVKPALNSLREGEVYRLVLQLRNASTSTGTASNFSSTLDFQVRPAMVTPYTTQVTGLTVTNPNAIAPFGPSAFDYNQNNFTLSWLPAAGAVRYEIHARDTTTNPNFVRINTITATGAPRYELNQALPSGFGPTFSGFGTFPLAGGNQVFFVVVGVDAFGSRGPLMGATAVQVKDSIPPAVVSLALVAGSSNDGINDGTSAAEIRLRLLYSEPMDPMSAVTYTTNATNAPATAWRWDTASFGRSGVLTLTVAAGNDATGSFTIRGGRDQAGNDLSRAGDTVGVLGGRRELLQTPDFQMGTMCQLGGWMPVVAMGGPTPSAVNNNGAFGGNTGPCAALLGSAPGGAPGVGRSRIVQNVTLPMVMNSGFSIEATGRYRVVNLANSATAGAAYRMECRVTDSSELMPLGTLFSVLPAIGTASTSYTSAGPVSLTSLGGTQVRVICEAENINTMAPGFGALYLDELSVALVKPGTL